MVAHTWDADDGPGTQRVNVERYHKKCTAKLLFAENRHRKIANTLNLWTTRMVNGFFHFRFLVVNFTNAFSRFAWIVHPTSGHELRGFGREFVDYRLTPFPMVDRHIAHIANVAHRGQRWMQEKRKQWSMMLVIGKWRRKILRWHQND